MTEMTTLAWLASPFWNREEHRLRALFRIVGFGVVSWGLGRLATAIHLKHPGNPDLSESQLLVRLGLILLSLWITARLFERRTLAETGYQLDRPFWREFGIGLALGALLMAGIFTIELRLGWVAITGFFRSGLPGHSFARAFMTPLVLFIGVGIWEEAIARGLLMRTVGEGLSNLRISRRIALVLACAISAVVFGIVQWNNPGVRLVSALNIARGGAFLVLTYVLVLVVGRGWSNRTALALACVISSALFGWGHWNNPGATLVSTLNIAVAGAFLALPYLLTGRLAMPMGLHMTWNLFQGNVFGFPVSGTTSGLETTVIAIRQLGPVVWTGGTFGPEAGILGLMAMGVGSIAVFLAVRDRQGRAEIQESLAAPPVRRLPRPTPLPPPEEPAVLVA
jgi:membrane protease YdiL (CAAX protease family)